MEDGVLLEIESLIFVIRGMQVMIDRDLAKLYGVETKVLNQAVKRNIDRFPVSFRFQLTSCELNELVTICDRLQSFKHSSVLPHAFTEQGVAMLSAVLRSDTAVKVSIRIMESFVRMRQFLTNHSQLFYRMDLLEKRMSETEGSVENIMKILGGCRVLPSQGIFYDGQIYDAYSFVSDLIRLAEERIILIDNYIDDTVLTLLDKRKEGVEAIVYTKKPSAQLHLDLSKHNTQYRPIIIREFTLSHDRFLIIDSKVYLIGASIKDLGKKWFGFTTLEDIKVDDLINRLEVE